MTRFFYVNGLRDDRYGVSVARMHLAWWPGAIVTSAGMAASQAGMQRGQRGAKEHPEGSAPGDGTVPSMACSGALRSVLSVGIEPSNPRV